MALPDPKSEAPLFTVGHSIRSLEEFSVLLQAHRIEQLIDVRTVPRSRRNPQFNKDTLPGALLGHGIRYRHCPDLGGLRHPRPDSPNTGWRNDSFRGYADYMQTQAFVGALEELIAWSRQARTALMCAEAVPWRCHRSLIADALTIRGIAVHHLIDPAHSHPHRLTPFVHVQGHQLSYPAPLSTAKPSHPHLP